MSSIDSDDYHNFIKEHSNFVIKLRLVGVGGTPQVRRVPITKIGNNKDADSGIAFNKLVNLAIKQTFPSAPLVPEDYTVHFSYYDVDGDCITIASSEELVDAIEQYVDAQPPVLRLTADVKRSRGYSSPPGTPTRNVQSPVGRLAATHNNSSSTPPGPQVHIQNAMDSFVTVLAQAVVALKDNVVKDLQQQPSPIASRSASGITSSTTSSSNSAHGTASNEPSPSPTDESTEVKATASTKEGEEEAPNANGCGGSGTIAGNTNERPFIHGRHTCDGCLCTPIIGTRYHATNLPDYDVCSKCFENYKGKEIKFEATELDRDRPFQARWNRRRERWANGRRGPCPGGRGNRRHHNRPSRGISMRSCHPAGPSPNEMDAALKAAIRLSLEDENKEKSSIEKETVESDVVPPPKTEEVIADTDVEAKEDNVGGVSKDKAKLFEEKVETDDSHDVDVDAEVNEEEDEGKRVEDEQPKTEESFSSAAAGSGDVAEALGQTLDECAKAIDGIMTELIRDEAKVNKSGDEDSSEPGIGNEEEQETKVNEEEEEVSAMTCSVPSVLDASKDAEAESTEEVSKTGATILESNEPSKDDDDNADIDESDTKSNATENEWQEVVDEDGEIQARAFQMIGSSLFDSQMSTAHMGGAASGDVSAASSSSKISEPLSVPSDVKSIVASEDDVGADAETVASSKPAAAAVARWAPQLAQLRELGFDNEGECVDVLEMLYAANVGCGASDEEVTVTQVIEVLLKEK